MKRFLFLLGLILLLGSTNCVYAANDKAELKAVKNILKSQIQAANKYSYQDFIKYFDFSYINSDGFGLDIYSKLVEDTWASYSNIQYAQKIKNITINGKDAIAEVVETANAQIESQYDLTGHLKSVANNIYFLKKTTNGWRIVSDVILTEDTYLTFGELRDYTPVLKVPYQIGANQNYTASLEYQAPKNTIAIASINQEKVTYPQQASKENYRKLPDDGVLERFFTANGDGVNEYIVASLGLTRPEFENKDLQINVTGVAYVIKRVNVIPENKFINTADVVPVSQRLQQLKDEETKAVLESAEKKKQDRHEIKQNEKLDKSETDINQENKDNNISAPVNDSTDKSEEVSQEDEKSVPVTDTEKQVSDGEANSSAEQNVIKDSSENVKPAVDIPEPGDKVKKKNKKDKSLKGTYSPDTVDIPTSATVCPVKEPAAAEN